MQLILLPGPKLLSRDWDYDESSQKGSHVETDVTEHASRYLFETVALDPALTLRDIFLLLDTSHVLQEVYASHGGVELLLEIMAGSVESREIEYDPNGIEYLELYQVWQQDSCAGQLQPIHRLWFHGVGFLLREVFAYGGVDYSAGARVKWSISFLSPLDRLHLPVRLNPEVILCEANVDSVNYGNEIGRMSNPGASLGQIMDGVLWELSFYGDPSSRDEKSAELKSMANYLEFDAATHSVAVDFFAGYKATLVSCFVDTNGKSLEDLYIALQEIDDQANAEMEFQNKLEPNIRLKPAFCGHTGMELRAYIRENSEIAL